MIQLSINMSLITANKIYERYNQTKTNIMPVYLDW